MRTWRARPVVRLAHGRGDTRMRASFGGFGAGLALCCALFAATAGARPQVESSVACDEATEPLPVVYGQCTTGCAIAQPTDLDRFAVAATAGETLRVTLESTSAGLDPRVEIRDPLGAVVGTTSCNGHAGFNGSPSVCSLVFELAIATTGDHQLAVSDGGADNTGNYVLQLERVPPVPPLPVLPYNLAVDDRIGPPTDRDCMAWEATANTQVQVTLRTLTAGLDAEVQVLDPTGAIV